jgi:hypothetical protein
MNLKNAWKEFRIVLGWKYNKLVSIYFLSLLLMTVFSFLWFVAWALIMPNFKDISVTNEIAYSSIRIFASYSLILIALFLVVDRLSIRTVPENWRIVIDMAEEFLKNDFKKIPPEKRICDIDDVQSGIELTRVLRKGRGLRLLVSMLKALIP